MSRNKQKNRTFPSAKVQYHQKRRLIRPRPNMLRCPEPCGKIRCFSEKEAWDVGTQTFHDKGGEPPKRVYECSLDAGIFHWTRQEKYDG